ncbi:glycosyltransferase family 8 protein [Diplodia corticola]|uniref:Glycosyltransferase family 8 protein n=1 Tax=Diplodia corticola TaxID=236234 RepID=A0A1J9R8D8_9PEZI|nr:glycosyltransferase family 8 protein [Diplodia corticola]OJD28659.1 glycosyltransferase family 8 protein [Diplodia corticola]
MVMLTGGQVSMAISSSIVFIFTFLLFLSGYILQQQTVRGIQEAIKPRLPQPKAPVPEEPFNPNARLARVLGSRDPAHEKFIAETQVDWRKLGYVQLVTHHRDVCTAVMQFAELHREKSPASRVLLFPRAWIEDEEDDDPYLETSRRLLRAAARRYRVVLRPVDPVIKGDGDSTRPRYSLASFFSLIDFDRLLYLAPSGIIIDSLAMDALLAFAASRRLAALPEDPTASRISTDFMLLQPSLSTFRKLSAALSEADVSDTKLFQKIFDASTSLLPPTAESETTLYYESSELRTLDDPESFNSTQFLSTTAYVRLADPELPGPEYDVPYGQMVQLRPKEDEPRWVWEKLYFKFRGSRMDVCGLDLLMPSKPKVAAATDEARYREAVAPEEL